MVSTTLALLLALTFQNPPDAFPREGAKQVFDNERVTVWDVTWERGKPTATHLYRHDMVGIELAAAFARVTSPDGSFRDISTRTGQAFFVAKGTTQKEETRSDAQRRAILIDLKDVSVPPLANRSGYVDAFPREGAQKLFENTRVIVWEVRFTPGKPSAMHFHDKDVVAIYLDNGEMASTTPDGKSAPRPASFGEARFNPRDRTHSELLVKGSMRLIAVELK
jgi:hypothetical protein